MDRTLSALLVLLLAVLGCAEQRPTPHSVAAAVDVQATPSADPYVGEWEVQAVWAGAPANGAKHWRGTMTLARDPGDSGYSGTLILRCQDVTWIVTQEVEVTIDHGTMTVIGANVEELEKPEGGGGYGYDVFEVQERNGLWFSGNASGESSGTGSVTITKQSGPI